MDDSNYFWESAQSSYQYIEDLKSDEERKKEFEAWQKTLEGKIWDWTEMRKLINY